MNLTQLKKFIEENITFESKVTIERTATDLGAGIFNDTIIMTNTDTHCRSYQALYPSEINEAKKSVLSLETANEIVAKMNERGW